MNKPITEMAIDPRRRELREMLLERRDALLADIRARQMELRASSGERAESSDESGEGLAAAPETELYSVVIERRARLLEQLNLALIKVDEGTYAQCEECDEPIPLARLRALAFAVRCTRCQEALEERSRRDGRRPGPIEAWDENPADRAAGDPR